MEFQVFFLFPFQFPNLFGLNSVSSYILSFNLFVKTCDWISVIFIHLRSGPGFFSGSPTNRVPAPPNRWRTRSWKKATKVVSEALKKQIKVCLARKVGLKKMQKNNDYPGNLWKPYKTHSPSFSFSFPSGICHFVTSLLLFVPSVFLARCPGWDIRRFRPQVSQNDAPLIHDQLLCQNWGLNFWLDVFFLPPSDVAVLQILLELSSWLIPHDVQ